MGKLEERHHSEDLGVDEGMTLKWNSMKLNEEARTGLLCFGIGTGGEGL